MWGRSAGGLTVGATLNAQPDLFKAAILDVPFLDVLSTMSDISLPLTVIEFDEWGDPTSNKTQYDYILEYSPVDNVKQNGQKYPDMLVTGGLNDPRVPYWEPVKFVQRVRDSLGSNNNTSNDSNNLALLVINMGAGHFASSGLEDRLAETAMKYAFLLETAAPCKDSYLNAAKSQGSTGTCENCFAVFGVFMSMIAIATLVIVLKPRQKQQDVGGHQGGSNSNNAWSLQGFKNVFAGQRKYQRAAEAEEGVQLTSIA